MKPPRGGEVIVRRLFIILAVASLLVCVAAVGLGVRSYFASDTVRWNVPRFGGLTCFSSRGRWLVMVYRSVPGMRGGFDHSATEPFDFDDNWAFFFESYRSRFGFGFGRVYGGRHLVVVPYWAILVMAAAAAAFAVRTARRKRRPGFCPVCSYDLRASRDRCPECGALIAQ
jgi:hypothetical protein